MPKKPKHPKHPKLPQVTPAHLHLIFTLSQLQNLPAAPHYTLNLGLTLCIIIAEIILDLRK